MADYDTDHLEKELGQFLHIGARGDVKNLAIDYILGITDSTHGKQLLGRKESLLEGIVSLTEDDSSDISAKAYKALINLATDEENCLKLLNLSKYQNICIKWLKVALDCSHENADLLCKLLNNVTRPEKCADQVAKCVLDSKEDLLISKMVLALCNPTYNEKADLYYLAGVLANLSQIRDVRLQLMDKKQCIIQRLLPFVEFKQSEICRTGVVATLKNCSFDTDFHDWLLGEEVDILPRLLLPLAGPEEFDEDDMEKLPVDLQYLPTDKSRESVSNIRKMLVEAIFQLCATKTGRSYVKSKNTYIIIREYHKWERRNDPSNEPAIMNLIDILIGDEPAPGMENLKAVEIPTDLMEKFKKEDEDDMKEILNEGKKEETC
ncbi:hypothetical protein ACJMK2_011282 [Sinanodonta woodiana]|uniref:Protein HGH1 homolog n=1 Tax=Sinanodonta woodiana TaxID=1069815 RepID=A0ABD3V4G0_SINWO